MKTKSPDGDAHVATYDTQNGHIVSGNPDAVDAVADSASDAGAGKGKRS